MKKDKKDTKQLLKEFLHSVQPIGCEYTHSDVDLSVLEIAGFTTSKNIKKEKIRENSDPDYADKLISIIQEKIPNTLIGNLFLDTLNKNKKTINWVRFEKSLKKYYPDMDLKTIVQEPEEEEETETTEDEVKESTQKNKPQRLNESISIKDFKIKLHERNWKLTIDVKDIWSENEDNDMADDEPVGHEWLRKLVSKLESYKRAIEYKLGKDIADEYNDIIIQFDEDMIVEDFNYVWNELYDWADANSVWIKTQL